MKKIPKRELLAILAAAGVSTGSAIAANVDASSNSTDSFGKVEHASPRYLGDESSCGKGSCGKDEKGAEAAKEKQGKAKKEKKEKKKEGKKKEEKSEGSEKSGGDAKSD